MESQFSVEYGSLTPNQETDEVFPSTDPHVSPPYWQFVGDFKRQMGEDAEPDALFFVESWMLGTAAAIENLKQRREAESPTQSDGCAAPDCFASGFVRPEHLNSESFVQERAQFCTSHYAVPQTPAPESFANRPHRKLQDCSDPVAEDFESIEQPNLPMNKQRALEILGVAATSTRSQIKSAFRRLVNEWHPDRFEWRTERARQAANEKMSAINKAYQLLRNTL